MHWVEAGEHRGGCKAWTRMRPPCAGSEHAKKPFSLIFIWWWCEPRSDSRPTNRPPQRSPIKVVCTKDTKKRLLSDREDRYSHVIKSLNQHKGLFSSIIMVCNKERILVWPWGRWRNTNSGLRQSRQPLIATYHSIILLIYRIIIIKSSEQQV
jgi:hypothetical protein